MKTLNRMLGSPLVGIGLVSLLCSPALGQEQTPLQAMRELYQIHTPENFDDGGDISHYVWKNFPAFYPHATVARTGTIRELEVSLDPAVAGFQVSAPSGLTTLDDYVKNSPLVDGLIVLARGEVVYEAYPRMQPYDRHLGWSITKVLVSTALAALENQGRVDVDRPVEDYVPELRGTAWQGTSVRHVVNMASGIACLDSDGYQNTEACIYRFEESLGLTAPVNPPQSTLENIINMRRHRPANERYEYVSANTFVTGKVIENITGQPLWLALQELLCDRIGAEADAMLMIGPDGTPASHGGLSARLRDIARFGQIFTSPDNIGVVSETHLNDLGSAKGIEFDDEQMQSYERRFPGDAPSHAAWQWDMIWPDGAMYKGGYSGQGIYVDPNRFVVIAWYGTDNTEGLRNRLLYMARQLASSGLLDR